MAGSTWSSQSPARSTAPNCSRSGSPRRARTPQHGDGNDYVLGVFALITVVLASHRLVAQTDPLPAVDLRRNLALTSEVWPGDFNGDGVTDLVASRSAFPRVPSGLQVVLGVGNGTFGPPILTDFAGTALAVGDFNNDRRLDVVAGPP